MDVEHINKIADEIELEWGVGGVWGNTLYSSFFFELLKRLGPEWISVEDRLPDNSVEVLIWALVGGYLSGCRRWEARRGYYSTTYEPCWCLRNGMTTDVTHWMPLPAPPEDK